MGEQSASSEISRLASIARESLYAAGPNSASIAYSFAIAKRFLSGRRILELGPAEGVMTSLLSCLGMELTLVEGSAQFCEGLRQRFPQATVVHSLFEAYQPSERFDNIVLGHVLEHVADPAGIVKSASEWLAPGARMFAAVPNARSLHRQAAVIMGLLSEEHELNKLDLHHGHRRVFDPESFRALFLQAGLHIESFGGYWLKPVSNAQIEQSWNSSMLDAFMRLGERYPDIAGEIYVVAHC
jgi:2-polyprenyl-3-methyl-5-hydroxy-6-metoxy-1,4-benzoquinol methylase